MITSRSHPSSESTEQDRFVCTAMVSIFATCEAGDGLAIIVAGATCINDVDPELPPCEYEIPVVIQAGVWMTMLGRHYIITIVTAQISLQISHCSEAAGHGLILPMTESASDVTPRTIPSPSDGSPCSKTITLS